MSINPVLWYSSLPIILQNDPKAIAALQKQNAPLFRNFLETAALVKEIIFLHLPLDSILAWRIVAMGYSGASDDNELNEKYKPNRVDPYELTLLEQRKASFASMRNIFCSNLFWEVIGRKVGLEFGTEIKARDFVRVQVISDIKRLIREVNRYPVRSHNVIVALLHTNLSGCIKLSYGSIATLRNFRELTYAKDRLGVLFSVAYETSYRLCQRFHLDQVLGSNCLQSINELAEHIKAWMCENQDSVDTIDKLDFGTFKLSYLPDEIGTLTQVSEMTLADNYLSELPNSFGKLTNLRNLYIEHNYFKTFPTVIMSLTNLEGLDLEGNQLRHIPESLTSLNHLQTLALRDNPGVVIPQSILEMRNLIVLSE